MKDDKAMSLEAVEPKNEMIVPIDTCWQSDDEPGGDNYDHVWRLDTLFEDIIAKVDLEYTDTSNAEEWSVFQDSEYVYNHSSQYWMRWTGSFWKNDSTGQSVESVKLFAAWIWDTTLDRFPEDDHITRGSMLKKVKKLSDIREIHDCLKAATTISNLSVTEDILDCHPELINFANGTYDLKTHEFRANKKDDYLTKALDFDYDANATEMPNFERFMATTFRQDEQMIDYVYDCLCDSISGIIHRPLLQFWYGGGRNGKSILWNAVMGLLGPYALKINFSVLQDRTNPDRAQNEKARLKGIRFVVTSEVGVNSVLSEAVVKDIVSNDTMEARKLRQSTFQFQPTHHVVMVGNHQPQIRESSLAIKRRLVVIPFINTIPEEEVVDDTVLLGSFIPERAAIMNRLIESYKIMQALEWKHASVPLGVQQYTQEYWDDNDILKEWMDECCDIITEEDTWLSELFTSYSAWSAASKQYSISKSKFTRMLKDYIEPLPNISIQIGRAKRKFVRGIVLKPVPIDDGGDGGENERFLV